MENADGIFEARKILILSVFYLFAYFGSYYLFKIMHSVYLKQLKNALLNLDENSLQSIDHELKKHKQIGRIVFVILSIIVAIGIILLFYNLK